MSLKKWIVVFHGLSGVGKDTATREVMRYEGFMYEADIIKFSRPMKMALANLLGVEVSKLEDRDYRNTKLPGLGVTPLDLMIRSFEFLPMLHPELMVYNIRQSLERLIEDSKYQDHVLVFNDVRLPKEVTLIQEAMERHSYQLLHVDIQRPGVEPMPSDTHYHGVSEALSYMAHRRFTLYNNWEVQQVHSKVNRILHSVSLLS